VPKTVLLAPARDGGQVCTRSFIPVQPHTSIGVLGAVSVVTGMLLPGAVGHELTEGWPADSSQVDVEHPTGHLLVDVVVDATGGTPRVLRSGVVRTARKLFDGTAFPRG
jgi:4-oxalomesaconate tautomerase